MARAKGIDDFTVEFSDQARKRMEDPECGEAVRDQLAQLRAALSEIDSDDPEAIAAAMEAFGATRIDPEDIEDLEEDDGHG